MTVLVREGDAENGRVGVVGGADEQLPASGPMMDDSDAVAVVGDEIEAQTYSGKGRLFDPGQATTS